MFNSAAINPTCDPSVVSEPGLLKFGVKLVEVRAEKLQKILQFSVAPRRLMNSRRGALEFQVTPRRAKNSRRVARYRHGADRRGATVIFEIFMFLNYLMGLDI